jgi:multidrug efflux pump subunit AcrB
MTAASQWRLGGRWWTGACAIAGSRSAATLGALALGVVGMGKVEQQFFPDSNRPELLVDLWLPEGSSFEASEALAKRVEQKLMITLPDAGAITTFVGQGVPNASTCRSTRSSRRPTSRS